VAIKVDREERPDIDGIYMDAVQAMTGSGGWPLSAFLTPEGRPFYAGTYFPPEPRHGMPAFRQVLEALAETWRERRGEVTSQADQVTASIGRASSLRGSPDPLSEEITATAFANLRHAYDERWGGFGEAPKFPQPMTLEFCLRQALRGRPEALGVVTTTLDRMSAGGMYDQLGGGFARYSTDGAWLVPHFEKMLYDNAQLALLFTRAWQVTSDPLHRRVASETLDYLLREMRHPEGGFLSSQDADSEGAEGKFFTWSWDELVSLVGEHSGGAFGASPGGNWEGTNVLRRPDDVQAAEDARLVLFEARAARVRPATDDKVLAAWNGLAIRAFAEAGRAFDEARYTSAAISCGRFVMERMRRDDGRLLRSWRDGVAGRSGFADDHALMAQACLTLYEVTFDHRWFSGALELAQQLTRLFHDPDRGGFFQTGSDQEALVIRPKDLYDNAVPSGNSAAAEVLQRLALLSGDADLERPAISALRLVRDAMAAAPTGFGHALCALDLYLGPTREVALIGDPAGEPLREMASSVAGRTYRPNVVLAAAEPGDAAAAQVVPLLRDRVATPGATATAFVCERFACRLPVTEVADLEAQLTDMRHEGPE
jgi:hypothetical protein